MQDNVAYPFAPRPSRFSTGLSPPPLGAQWPWQVNTMLRNADQLEDLRGKVTVMGDNSKQFFRLSRDNRVMQQCRESADALIQGEGPVGQQLQLVEMGQRKGCKLLRPMQPALFTRATINAEETICVAGDPVAQPDALSQ